MRAIHHSRHFYDAGFAEEIWRELDPLLSTGAVEEKPGDLTSARLGERAFQVTDYIW
jgi:hypothetical protein